MATIYFPRIATVFWLWGGRGGGGRLSGGGRDVRSTKNGRRWVGLGRVLYVAGRVFNCSWGTGGAVAGGEANGAPTQEMSPSCVSRRKWRIRGWREGSTPAHERYTSASSPRYLYGSSNTPSKNAYNYRIHAREKEHARLMDRYKKQMGCLSRNKALPLAAPPHTPYRSCR